MNLTTPLTISTFLHSAALVAVLTVGVQMVPERTEIDLDRFVRVEPVRPTSSGHVTVAAWMDPAEPITAAPAEEPVPEEQVEPVASTPPAEPEPMEPAPERVEAPTAPSVEEPRREQVAEAARPQEPTSMPEETPVEPVEREIASEVLDEAPAPESTQDAVASATATAGEGAEDEVRLPGDSEVALAWPGAGDEEREPLVDEEPAGLGVDLDALEAAYRDQLNRAVQRAYRYPRVAQRAGIEGTVVVRVTLSAAGEVVEVVVLTSSGHGILDRAAIDAIASVRSFPAPPSELAAAGRFRSFDLPVGYSLRM